MQIFVCPLFGSKFVLSAMQHRIYKCPHSGLSWCPHLRGFDQYAFYVNQSGPLRSVRLIKVSVFQGVRIEGFNCIYIESVDSISRDERDVPLTQYIRNA